ncbi:PAS domain S-box protein [Virgibacillus flavescens]|uniref:PAS domain S-box protein n=1 Tax=Virgibacillus flavescens TaxID=1611422 RepID=UPI003D33027D
MNGVTHLASLRPVVKGGRVVEVIASCVDITERIKVEEALKQSETNSRLIAEHMSDFTAIIDASGLVKYASPSHEELFGLSPSSLEGHSIFKIVEPIDFPNLREKFESMIASKTPFWVNYRFKDVQGQWRYLEAQWIPVLNEKENIKHIVIASRNVTDRKKPEDSMR